MREIKIQNKRKNFSKINKNRFLFFFRSLYYWTDETYSIKSRILFLCLTFAAFYCIISFKILKISLDPIKNIPSKIYENSIERKEIYDRTGTLLAGNIPVASLYANPSKIENIDSAIKKLKTILPNLNFDKLKQNLTKDKTFVWIERDISPKTQINLSKLGIEGIYFIDESKRFYTQGRIMSHVLGHVNRDNIGMSGFEGYFDKNIRDKSFKKPIKLTIDHRVQEIVSNELEYTINKFNALGGVGIVVDVTNGEIISMVSKPDFDPHKPQILDENAIFNRASLGNYEIGSVFKAITFATAFDAGKIKLNDVYHINDYSVARFRIKDYHNHTGWNTIPQIFINSSNIGSSMIAIETGGKILLDYFKKLGLSNKLDIEILEKSTPSHPKENISTIDLVTMSYGYRISISPLHFVQAMVPIVNGGYKYPLTILKTDSQSSKVEKILKTETSIAMNKLLRLTVEKGTGRKAAVKGFLVGGKTGTANKVVGKSYDKHKRLSSFIAITPALSPKYLIFVMIDEPKGIKETFGFATAGYTAAPTAGNIIRKISSLFGIKPINEEDENIKDLLHVDYQVDHET